MAGAGEFPKTTGDLIYAADYNTIRNIAYDVVYNTYGNGVSAGTVSGGGVELISSAHMDNLRSDINKAYRHITNGNSGIADIAADTLISHADWNAYKAAADYISANRYTASASQLSLTTDAQTIYGWNGSHTFWRRYTWSSDAAANYWFNTGGYFAIDVSGDSSDGSSKANDWQNNILNAIATPQVYNRNNWVANSNVNIIDYGNTGQYTENYCQIYTNKPANNILDVYIVINDADTGDQWGVGPPVDENVNCNANCAIYRYTSFDAITAENPSSSAQSNW